MALDKSEAKKNAKANAKATKNATAPEAKENGSSPAAPLDNATPEVKSAPVATAVAVEAPAKTTATIDEAAIIAEAATAAGAAAVAADEDDAAQLEVGFTISLISPGLEPLQIQVSSMELVQEIHQLLMDREDTCHRTCFSLQLDGVTLDNFAELKNIDGLTEGSVVRVAEEPYTMREARIHVRHVRDLLKSMDTIDAYNGHDCFSLTFLNTITSGDAAADTPPQTLAQKKQQQQQQHPKARADSVDCTPPEYIMPGTKERPLLPLQPGIAKNAKGSPTIKVLTTSAWNPPPGPRKLHGDLMYLYVVTLEEKRFHITACPRGFYINQSTEDTFNPRADTPSHLCHSLIELLSQISPAFKRAFALMQKKRTLRHPFERVATPYQVYTWAAPQLENTLDAIRAEDTFSSKLGYEEHIPGQTRDWNEELQTTRELSRKGLNERLLRERAIFKVHSDFVTAATRGAMAVIDGNVMAINPGDDPKMQMYIWNNIFFSLGFDVRDHYKELGGDAAAFVAPRNDLHGVRVYSAVDVEGLYTLGTVIVDYRGYRVTAQSIIPGILEREQEQSVVYGSIDFGKNVLGHEKYMELLSKAGQQLKVLPHSVRTEKDNASVDICSSVECKGIIGNDGRHYILDLLRTFPPDVNFLRTEHVEYHADVKAMGFPIEHKHKLSCLRQELLDAFVEDRYVVFIKYAAYHLQQIGATLKQQKQKKDEEEKEKKLKLKAIETGEQQDGENNNVVTETPKATEGSEKVTDDRPAALTDAAKQLMDTLTDGISSDEKQAADSKEVVKRACAAVGSLKEFEFDIRFNADAFSPGIQHVEPESEFSSLAKQRKLVADAAQFLVLTQIPTFVRECLEHTSAPMDGVTLTEALHIKGINIRYLGKVTSLLAKVPRLDYLHTIAVQELVLRAAKHIFVATIQNTELMQLSSAISHFLNCLLTTTGQTLSPVFGHDELLGGGKAGGAAAKRRNKNANKKNGAVSGATTATVTGTNGGGAGGKSTEAEWATMTQKSLWQLIKREAKQYWDFELPCDGIETAVEQFGFHKLGLLRAFCQKVGVQVLLREYHFESRNKPTFGDDDIVNVFPIVKHINPRASDAYNFYTTGQTKIQQGLFKEGYDLISEALNLLNNVHGAMHSENAQCLRMLARLSYIMGDPQEALAIQQRAVLMSERVNGIDHPYTISEYTHLALYSFANSQISTALKLLYRARYLTLLICGDNHPDIALLDSNISLILHAVGEFELSLRFLEHALALNLKYYGEKSLKVAVSYHLVARTQSCMGDFRSALNSEKETYAIYKQQLGEGHQKTQESSECLRHLTNQAVVLQKKMNTICTNGKITSDLPPIHIQPPSMDSVLDMLNAINGILFVEISPKELANLRSEIEKRQPQNGDAEADASNAIEGGVEAAPASTAAVLDTSTTTTTSTAPISAAAPATAEITAS